MNVNSLGQIQLIFLFFFPFVKIRNELKIETINILPFKIFCNQQSINFSEILTNIQRILIRGKINIVK